MSPVDLALIMIAPCAVERYLAHVRAVGPLLFAATAVADEQFVTRSDGGGWIVVDVHVRGVHVLSAVCPLDPGDWRWIAPLGKGGVS